MLRLTFRPACIALLLCLSLSCLGNSGPSNYSRVERMMTVTAYCDCKVCTGWERNWRFPPVFASGPNKGERKKVGVTATGTKARRGTIAADTSRYPFGTRMKVPGYGKGTVEDVGSAIKGEHIDLFFKDHKDAQRWGVRKLKVTVWLPQ
ncbi:MAG: 3D domain-containing protein [Candidatus Hydrogenedentes bacterium]|nr:3D domain-containing protein [Candidatus Hydrogenedentota bacterium]